MIVIKHMYADVIFMFILGLLEKKLLTDKSTYIFHFPIPGMLLWHYNLNSKTELFIRPKLFLCWREKETKTRTSKHFEDKSW